MTSSHRIRSARRGRLAVFLFLLLAAALLPARAWAQGCVASGSDAAGVGALPGLGSMQGFFAPRGRWQLSTTWRYFESDRHFRGTTEETHRTEEGSQVINTVHQFELALSYQANPRWSLTFALPYLMADRSSPLRNAEREVKGRASVHSRGIGDLSFVARRWMLDPTQPRKGNFTLGIGIKLPTGDNSVEDTRIRADDADADGVLTEDEMVYSVETVDQSIQPGDGGFGVIFDFQGYRSWMDHRVTLYGSAFYLANPEGTDKVPTYRSREPEKYMSIPDRYVARVGTIFSGPGWKGWSAGIGGRIEGVPVHDLFGSSKWFRRPGYTVSAEPSFSWTGGKHAIGVAVPIALQRDRQRSVPDRIVGGGRHGDAAFADWSLIATWSVRFGKPGEAAAMSGHEQ